MRLNIVLAVAIGALTLFMAALGGQLAATKEWHKWAFWAPAGLIVILIFVQTLRTERAQGKVQAQLDAIEKHTEEPPQVTVNVPPGQVSSKPKSKAFMYTEKMDLLELTLGEPIRMNVYCANSGPDEALNAKCPARLYVVDTQPLGTRHEPMLPEANEEKAFRNFLANGIDRTGEGRTVAPHTSAGFLTAEGPTFTSELSESLRRGDKEVLLAAAETWRDDRGSHRNETCYWLQAGFTKQSQTWHSCTHHKSLVF